MLEWITNTINYFGYWGIALLMFLENLFPPIPSELIMPLAGFTASPYQPGGAKLNIIGVFFAGSSKDITKAKEWFNRQGRTAVLIGRLVPGIRTLISVPAGMTNMPFLPFLFYTTLGSAAWVGLLTYSGYILGIQYELVDKYLAPVSKIVLGGLVLAFVFWIFKRQLRRTRR